MRLLALPLIALAVFFTAGCSGDSEAPASNATGTSSVPPSTDTPLAPQVKAPLKTAAIEGSPCAALPASQLVSLGLSAPGAARKNGPNGPTCSWKDKKTGARASVTALRGNPHGLEDVYRANKQKGYFAYFVPKTIGGYPAVESDAADLRSSGTCGLALGVSNIKTLSVQIVGSPNVKDPCGQVEKVTSAVVTNLKARR